MNSDNIIPFPPSSRPSKAEERAEHVAEKASLLDRAVQSLRETSHSRLSELDRMQLALNLGSLIEERASVSSRSHHQLLRAAWDDSLGSLAKRMRLVRFGSHEAQAGETFATQGLRFVKLAERVDDAAPSPGLNVDDSRRNAVSSLLRGTSFDPDPAHGLHHDLDSRAAINRTLEALNGKLLEELPGLSRYFRIISDQRLRAREISFDEWDERKARVSPFDRAHYFGGLPESNFEIALETIRAGDTTWPEWERWVLDRVGTDEGFDQFGFSTTEFDNAEHEPLHRLDRADLMPERLTSGLWLDNGHCGIASTWPRVSLGVLSLSQASDMTDANLVGERIERCTRSWLLHLAIAPLGGCDPTKLRLVLFAERMSDRPELSIPHFWSKNPTSPHWDPHVVLKELSLDDTHVWACSSDEGLRWLSLRLDSWGGNAAVDPDTEFFPFFTAPGGVLGSSARTIGGYIDRNLHFAPGSETLLARLVMDAQARINGLGEYLGEAQTKETDGWSRIAPAGDNQSNQGDVE